MTEINVTQLFLEYYFASPLIIALTLGLQANLYFENTVSAAFLDHFGPMQSKNNNLLLIPNQNGRFYLLFVIIRLA